MPQTDEEKKKVMADMDAAAEIAKQELYANGGLETARDVANWVKKHYLKAGYTRLCLLLREVAES